MARRFLLAGVIVLAFVAAGAVVALVVRDDDSNTTADTTVVTTTVRPTTTVAASTAPPASTAPTSTTLAPGAVPNPCGAESAAIRVAIDNAIEGARDGAQIRECRLAAADSSWARVELDAAPGATFGPLTVMLQGGGGTWAIVDQGTTNVGCGHASQQVLVDLGVVCTSTGGGA